MPTKIEWTDETWNPVTGCSPVSPGCQNCYAARIARRLAGRYGYPKENPFSVTLHPERLNQPFRWKKPRKIFVCSMADLFHDDVPFEFIKAVLARTCGISTECHTFIVLTKRPERMKAFFEWMTIEPSMGKIGIECPLPNVWLGVTVEDQEQADKRIPILLEIPAAVRFVSVEPMLEPMALEPYIYGGLFPDPSEIGKYFHPLNWVICGGETGPGARPMHIEWVRSLRDQCISANVPFFFKRWGTSVEKGFAIYRDGKKVAAHLIDGQEWNQFPEVEK